MECREHLCEADDKKAPPKTTSPPLSPAAMSPILPMIGASGCSCIFGSAAIHIALPREGLRPSRDVRSHDGFTAGQLNTSHDMPSGQPNNGGKPGANKLPTDPAHLPCPVFVLPLIRFVESADVHALEDAAPLGQRIEQQAILSRGRLCQRPPQNNKTVRRALQPLALLK